MMSHFVPKMALLTSMVRKLQICHNGTFSHLSLFQCSQSKFCRSYCIATLGRGERLRAVKSFLSLR